MIHYLYPMYHLIQLRHYLHQFPETALEETQTAQRILEFFRPLAPDQILENLGGTGLAFVFRGAKPGKRLRQTFRKPHQRQQLLPFESRQK